MKLGINPWTVYGWELPETIGNKLIHSLSEIGCEGLELVLDEGNNTSEILIAEKNKITKSLHEVDMEVTSVATALFWQYNLASQNAEVRQKGLKVTRDGCKVAHAFGVPVFLAVAGLQEPNVEYERTYETAVVTLQEAGNIAADMGGIIGVENVPSSFLMSPGEYRRFFEDVNHPAVKAYLDFGNGTMFGGCYPENWITAVKDNIALVHAKDYDAGGNSFVCCGLGDLNWEVVVQALHQVEYNEYLVVETPPKGGRGKPTYLSGMHAAQTSLNWLKKWY